MKNARSNPLLPWCLLALALGAGLAGCGGPPHKVDTDSIRRNADDADRDIDRESEKNKDQ